MGNSRSKEVQHEKLEEHSERYFKKVNSRNRVKSRDTSIPNANASSSSLNSKQKKGLRNSFRRSSSRTQKKSVASSTSKPYSFKSSMNSTITTTSLNNPQHQPPPESPSSSSQPEEMSNVRSRAAMFEHAELLPTKMNLTIPIHKPKQNSNSPRRRSTLTKTSSVTLPTLSDSSSPNRLPRPRDSSLLQSKRRS